MTVHQKTCLFFSVTLLFFQCGGSIPDMHYYLIDYPVRKQSDSGEAVQQGVLGVAKFEAAPLYQEERLVYRDSPYEGKYYHYHRWIASPEQMITEKVIEQLNASNLFKQVVAFPKYSRVDYLLQGTIKALEEWDEGEQWYARVQIAFDLVAKADNQIIWHTTSEQKNLVPQRTPAEIVKGINLGVQQCVVEAEQQLVVYFSK